MLEMDSTGSPSTWVTKYLGHQGKLATDLRIQGLAERLWILRLTDLGLVRYQPSEIFVGEDLGEDLRFRLAQRQLSRWSIPVALRFC